MTRPASHARECFLPRAEFPQLFTVLAAKGYRVIAPTIDQQAIVYDEVTSVDQLPQGWTDEQSPGRYRLVKRDDELYFGFTVGPDAWKKFLFPPRTALTEAERTGAGWQFRNSDDQPPKYAFLGVRGCDLAAIRMQDRIFLSGAYVDPIYQARRKEALIIAVNCTQAATTCFCTSMGTGPKCASGFDLALTELPTGFVVEVASGDGAEVMAELPTRAVMIAELQAAQAARERATQMIERRMDTHDIRDLLLSNLEHPQWDDVAARCLSCTNCTMVCPTCFCSSVDEISDLTGDHVQRVRQWDSCFDIAFSYMNGGTVRDNIRARYRQWLTHKLASWIDQFGSSGCVGCGRCITWCPPGIDLTNEVAAIRGAPQA